MIKNISIKNIASYGNEPEILKDLSKFNFIYGSNGVGKTTISRVIKEPENQKYSDSEIEWEYGNKMESLVYNRDFIEQNLNESNKIKGIFTLGEKDKKILDEIEKRKEDLDILKKDSTQLKNTLECEDSNGGKKGELKELESEFTEKIWEARKQLEDENNLLKEAFKGFRDNRNKFKDKVLGEHKNNASKILSLEEIQNKARTVFSENPQIIQSLDIPNFSGFINRESESILKKKVIGKSDVDIAEMIQKLDISDWVKSGIPFYQKNNNICPFCQQETDETLIQKFEEYFDETFEKDINTIKTFYEDYKNTSKTVQNFLLSTLDLENLSEFLDLEKIKSLKSLFDSNIQINIQKIEDKQKEPSRTIELESLNKILTEVKEIIQLANKKIKSHNDKVENIKNEKKILTGQVWKYFLKEQEGELSIYNRKEQECQKAIKSLEKKISQKSKEIKIKEEEVKDLEKDTTSIQPTIDDINKILKSFGFESFKLTKSDQERFYKIQRLDGTDVDDTLSEGEKSFVAFLYFYHLMKGSENEDGITKDRIVVFDDPVSSLDSDVLFIVSNLIRGLFSEIKNNKSSIKQIFVLTHNIYFHKQLTFNHDKLLGKNAKFWIVKKREQISKFEEYDTNPIKSYYELLWNELREYEKLNQCQNISMQSISIQNTLRKIIEYYFKILGNINYDKICNQFERDEKLICKSLISWVNAGSHSMNDDLYISIDESQIEKYLKVFKDIFHKAGQKAHYEMMINGSQMKEGQYE